GQIGHPLIDIRADQVSQVLDFIGLQHSSHWYAVPFRDTRPTAAGRCVLCVVQNVTVPWSLGTVFERLLGTDAATNSLLHGDPHADATFPGRVVALLIGERLMP